MRRIKIPIDDLLTVLQSMKDSGGTTEIIIFSHNETFAICDADEPESYITFSSVNEKGEVEEDDETVH